MVPDDPLLTPDEAARFLRRPASYLAKLRCFGGGPRFVKQGRLVRYRRSALEAWLAGLERASTSQGRR